MFYVRQDLLDMHIVLFIIYTIMINCVLFIVYVLWSLNISTLVFWNNYLPASQEAGLPIKSCEIIMDRTVAGPARNRLNASTLWPTVSTEHHLPLQTRAAEAGGEDDGGSDQGQRGGCRVAHSDSVKVKSLGQKPSNVKLFHWYTSGTWTSNFSTKRMKFKRKSVEKGKIKSEFSLIFHRCV